MNFLKGTVSVTRMMAAKGIVTDEVYDALRKYKFESRDNEELNVGFVDFFDITNADFENPEMSRIDEFLVFGVRIDRIKIPSAVMSMKVKAASENFMEKHPELKYLPKAEKEQIRDRVRSQLLQKYDPVPSMCQVAMNVDSGEVLIATCGKNIVDGVVTFINSAMPYNRVAAVPPMKRYSEGSDTPVSEAARLLNQAQTDSVLEWSEANSTIWNDFFSWMLYQTFNTDSSYQTPRGPVIAFLDEKFVLSGRNSEGAQKIVVTGSQVDATEVRAAIAKGLSLESVRLFLKYDDGDSEAGVLLDDRWMHLKSARIPFVRPEQDPDADPIADQQASFLVRMGGINDVQNIVDSLVKEFLIVRANDDSWKAFSSEFCKWTREEA